MPTGTITEPWIKDPDAIRDYDIDWSSWLLRLGGDTIQTSTWTKVSGNVTIASSEIKTSTIAKVWLSGGTLGETCELRNRITTMGQRANDQTVYVKIGQR